MAELVPKDDLPANLVPAGDMPDSGPSLTQKANAVIGTAAKLSPAGLVAEAGKRGAEGLEKFAYGAGQKATDVGTALGLPPQWAAGIGAGVYSIPNILPVGGGMAAGARAAPLMRRGAENLMQRALKPDLAARKSGDATKAVRTMLDEGVNVSPKGVEKLQGKISKFEEDLQSLLKEASDKGVTVNRGEVNKRLLEEIKRIKATSQTPGERVKVIQGLYNEAMNNPNLPMDIRVDLANTMKREIYDELGPKFFQQLRTGKEAAKDVGKHAEARGFREEVEKAVPESKALNQQMGPLINAKDIAQSRVLAAGNRDPLSLGSFAIRNVPELLAWLAQRGPATMSGMARGLNAGQKVIPAGAGALVGGAAARTAPKE